MACCALCGKHTVHGNKVTKVRSDLFSRSHRTFKPNLQKATLEIDGRMQKVKVCTRCKRTENRANRIRQ